MFRGKLLRWHTFRVVLLTSIVWMLFGFGVLVYYMDRNFMVNNSQAMLNGNPNGHPAESVDQPVKARIINTRVIKVKNSQEDSSNDNAQHTPLPPYSTDELRTWSEPAMKDNPRDWPGIWLLSLSLNSSFRFFFSILGKNFLPFDSSFRFVQSISQIICFADQKCNPPLFP